jgi:hypothetical protein
MHHLAEPTHAQAMREARETLDREPLSGRLGASVTFASSARSYR